MSSRVPASTAEPRKGLPREVIELRIAWRVAQLGVLAATTRCAWLYGQPLPWPYNRDGDRLWDDEGRRQLEQRGDQAKRS